MFTGMRRQVSAEEQAFRQQVRTWLGTNVPRARRPLGGQALRDFDLQWQRRQYEAGWAGISWPREYGGRGLSLVQQLIWYEECARADAPVGGAMFVALTHAGPTLITRGSEAQKAFHLPKILRGDAVWCQGFSEPNAGSDLASLKTQARLEGDTLVVNGSKIWTSYAYLADYQELLLRTDPAAPRHKGLTWVICDMRLPGITIQRIATMSGTGNLCQVFYDEVRIPIENVVGRINDGWNVSMTTLGFERGTAFINHQIALAATVDKLIELAGSVSGADGRGTALEDGAVAGRLATLRAEVAALRAMTYLSVSRGMVQEVPGPEGNIIALYYAELSKKVYALAVELLGPEGLEKRTTGRDWLTEYLDAFKNTIAGGSSQIRRNVIGERLLGLPRGR
jgi:alkylation response protein AidB-like acyl-CoA dehydrogenase